MNQTAEIYIYSDIIRQTHTWGHDNNETQGKRKGIIEKHWNHIHTYSYFSAHVIQMMDKKHIIQNGIL